jgi:Ribonucleotide reductase, alpha subunit
VANQIIETNDAGIETGKTGIESSLSFQDLNAMINLWGQDQKLQLEKDKIAVRRYFLDHVNQNTVFFHSLKERIDYLVENEYYEKEVLDQYSWEFIEELNDYAYSFKFRFQAFLGAFKFYTSYALKTFDGQRYLVAF